jgi:hypothetical protein
MRQNPGNVLVNRQLDRMAAHAKKNPGFCSKLAQEMNRLAAADPEMAKVAKATGKLWTKTWTSRWLTTNMETRVEPSAGTFELLKAAFDNLSGQTAAQPPERGARRVPARRRPVNK